MSADSRVLYAPAKKDVLSAAEGSWKHVFEKLAPSLSPFQARPGLSGPCPKHGGKDGFRIFKKTARTHSGGYCQTCGAKADGLALLMWVNNWSFNEAVAEVGTLFGVEDPNGRRPSGERVRLVPSPAVTPEPQQVSNEWIRGKLREIWKGSIPLTDPRAEPARLYLRSRGILAWDRPGLERTVRFHPSLAYPKGEKKGFSYPAIITCLLDPEGEAVTVNRLYITEKGEKAPVDEPKLMFLIPSDRTLPGSAVITSRPAEIVDVAEGLETALSVETAMDIPVWPMVNAYLLETFIPPVGTKYVRIWADKDRSGGGQRAALQLKKRLWEMGIRVQVKLPDMDIPDGQKSVDWNDVLMARGRFGFIGQEATRKAR